MTNSEGSPAAATPFMQYGTKAYIIGSDKMPDGVSMYDVALALAKINRYTGHTTTPYSVAQHSMLVAALVRPHPVVKVYALLHDVAETVVQDLSYPMKLALGADGLFKYKQIEHAAEAAIFGIVGIRHPIPEHIAAEVKRADWIASSTEKRDLMPPCDRPWDMLPYGPSFAKIMPDRDWLHVARCWYNEFNAAVAQCVGLDIPGPEQRLLPPPSSFAPPPPAYSLGEGDGA